MCDSCAFSRSGYYDSLDRTQTRGPSAASGFSTRAARVCRHKRHLRSVKIAKVLQQRPRLGVACETRCSAMRENGPEKPVSQAFTPTRTQADPTKQPAPNTLDRDFAPEAPNRKWVTDITYLATTAGLGLPGCGDLLFSRKVVGWAMNQSLATHISERPLRQQSRRVGPRKHLLHIRIAVPIQQRRLSANLASPGIACSMSAPATATTICRHGTFLLVTENEWTKPRNVR